MTRLMLCLSAMLLSACFASAPIGESRAGVEAECRLRFRAAKTVQDSVQVLNDRSWCRDVLVADGVRIPFTPKPSSKE